MFWQQTLVQDRSNYCRTCPWNTKGTSLRCRFHLKNERKKIVMISEGKVERDLQKREVSHISQG